MSGDLSANAVQKYDVDARQRLERKRAALLEEAENIANDLAADHRAFETVEQAVEIARQRTFSERDPARLLGDLLGILERIETSVARGLIGEAEGYRAFTEVRHIVRRHWERVRVLPGGGGEGSATLEGYVERTTVEEHARGERVFLLVR